VNDSWRVLVAVVAVFALTCGVLAAAWTRGRLGVVSISLFVASVVVWALDFAAVSSGYRDADGLFDCGDSCTGVHYASAIGFLAPPLLISLSALAMLILLVRRRRARRGR